ncbi:MAG: class I SAM-dependent methyltransferase [bacterium]|nr:class I SAM-dependent methyltransferase [bacterium]
MHMTTLASHDLERLQVFYERALAQFGPHDPQTLHWGSKLNQVKRFEVLAAVGDLRGKSILDAGCGTGDLYQFLSDAKVPVNYTGIDIVPDFIRIARERFPNVRFLLKDTFEENSGYDYVVASGTMSFKVHDNDRFYFEMIRYLYGLAKTAFAFNMLDRATHVDNETFAAYDPRQVADFCGTFCDHVQVVTDYLPDDFTVYLYKKVKT